MGVGPDGSMGADWSSLEKIKKQRRRTKKKKKTGSISKTRRS